MLGNDLEVNDFFLLIKKNEKKSMKENNGLLVMNEVTVNAGI